MFPKLKFVNIPLTMKKRTIFIFLIMGLSLSLFAQKKGKKGSKYTPASMTEVAAHGGYLFVAGDVSSQPGFGTGLSIRKATDYIFSLRADVLVGQMKGETLGPPLRRFTTSWLSGTLFGVIGINNFKWDSKVRKINLYAMAGAGANNFTTEVTDEIFGRLPMEIDGGVNPHATLGAGFAYRVSNRFNVGIEHQASVIFGRNSDFPDGVESDGNVRTPFRDIINYTTIRFSLNIGDDKKKEEPLYWLNPLDVVLDDLQDLKKKNKEVEIKDSDDDGVIDAIDKEPNTVPNARVDTKGVTLDSDRDGVPDHKDLEPYYTPRDGERVNSDGIVQNSRRNNGGGAASGVTEARVREIVDEALNDYQLNQPATGGMVDWFLPMVHFGADSDNIRYADYGTLAGIAKMLNNNADLKLVVTGFTDQSAGETYNDQLSYQRAASVIEHLVTKHGVNRNKLVLQWKGESEVLVAARANHYMNRRVEFKVARNETDMPAPDSINTPPKIDDGTGGY